MFKIIGHGSLLGFCAGVIITFLDTLLMIKPSIYIPPAYPIEMTIFNLCLWTFFGSMTGVLLSAYLHRKKCHYSMHYWAVFFLVPFVLIYGILGKADLKSIISPAFDNHLSFIWAGCIVLYLLLSKKRNTFVKTRPLHYLPEIMIIPMLFMFCSNINIIAVFRNLFFFTYKLFGSNSNLEELAASQTYTYYLAVIYTIGVSLLFGFYFFISLTWRPAFKKQLPFIIVLLTVVIGAEALIYSVKSKAYFSFLFPEAKPKAHLLVKKQPNIILIVLDTVRADFLSVYGFHQKTTVNLEAFSKDALLYTNCIATSSWTAPSHASLFTGLYPSEHDVHKDPEKAFPPFFFQAAPPLSDEHTTLAEKLKGYGYRTTGVISNYAALHKGYNLNQGFQIYNCINNIGSLFTSRAFKPIIHLFCYLTNRRPQFNQPYRTAEAINRFLFRFTESSAPSQEPFFLFVNYMDAHAPYAPPPPFDGYFSESRHPRLNRLKKIAMRTLNKLPDTEGNAMKVNLYKGEICYLDNHLGHFFDKLKATGLYDSSLIIITSDHGELFGEHGIQEHACALYEGVVKVPLLIKYPGNATVGINKENVSLVDVYDIILNAYNNSPDTPGQLPIPAAEASRTVIAEFYNHTLGEHRALYNREFKLMDFSRGKSSELYNLAMDSQERINLANQLPDKLLSLSKDLDQWNRTHTSKYRSGQEGVVITPEIKAGLKALGYIE